MSTNNNKKTIGKKDPSDSMAVASILLLSFIALILFIVYVRMAKDENRDIERIYKGAAALEASGLNKAALGQYDRYRVEKNLKIDEEADLLFKQGKIAEDELSDWNRALEYYTLASIYSPNSKWATEAGKRRFVCMEKLGKSKQAQSILLQMTDSNNDYKTNAYKAGGVVAVIDGRSVFWHEVRAAMVKYNNSDDTATRKELVNKYVFSWILAEEAVKAGIDEEPKTIIMIEQAQRDALAQAFIGNQNTDMGDKTLVLELWNRLTKLHEAKIFDDAIPQP
jgi:tetratricopeptide (TPR) repeat protein